MKRTVMNKAQRIFLLLRIVLVNLILFYFVVWSPAFSSAGGPTEQVRATVDKVLVMVKNPNLKSPAQKKDLQARLAEVI